MSTDQKQPFAFKTVKHVTLPLLKIETDTPYYVRFESLIKKSVPIENGATRTPKASADGTPAKAKMEPPEVVQVVNLETGVMSQMIVNAVLSSELKKNYPNDGYVKKCFEIIKHKIQGGKKYATFEITEIQVEAKQPEAPAKNVAGKK